MGMCTSRARWLVRAVCTRPIAPISPMAYWRSQHERLFGGRSRQAQTKTADDPQIRALPVVYQPAVLDAWGGRGSTLARILTDTSQPRRGVAQLVSVQLPQPKKEAPTAAQDFSPCVRCRLAGAARCTLMASRSRHDEDRDLVPCRGTRLGLFHRWRPALHRVAALQILLDRRSLCSAGDCKCSSEGNNTPVRIMA